MKSIFFSWAELGRICWVYSQNWDDRLWRKWAASRGSLNYGTAAWNEDGGGDMLPVFSHIRGYFHIWNIIKSVISTLLFNLRQLAWKECICFWQTTFKLSASWWLRILSITNLTVSLHTPDYLHNTQVLYRHHLIKA